MLICPRCASPEVRRSTFHWTDVPRAIVLLMPFRCRSCGKRFYWFWWSGIEVRPREILRTIENSVRDVYRTQRARAEMLSEQMPRPNRRAWVRHMCDYATSCQPHTGCVDQSWPARIRDISRGGVRLVMHHRFDKETILNIQMEGDDSQGTRVALLEVVHVEELPDGSFGYGCRFTKSLNDQEVARLAKRLT